MTDIQITQINPRVTLITEELNWVKSVSMGIIIASGSRYESPINNGITHLAEHMIFKGSADKTGNDIAKITESLGATVDGFTSKETSGIYFHFLSEKFDNIFNIFFQILRNAAFDSVELEKEKNVVLQEIAQADDDPREHAYELLAQVMFPDHPLSFPIAGTPKTVASFTRDDLLNWYRFNRSNRRICFSIAGNIKHAQVLDKLSALEMPYLDIDYWQAPVKPNYEVERKLIFQSRPEIKQIHTLAGFLTIPYTDSRRYGLTVLNNIIGGTQSSRLYQRLHEQDAILHYIQMFLDLYSDIGIWGGYHISNQKNREISLRVVFEENAKLKQNGITKDEFARSINYCKGMLTLAMENPTARMLRNGQKYLYSKTVMTLEESLAMYDKLTLDEVNGLIELFNFEDYSAAIIGPITRKDLGQIGIAPEKIIEYEKA
ncbi:MAG: insulinase family protein [Candidatus Latescibacteria bacterium]|nr:insulinase family protein [Candidatus Latescibacterota bacterium]